jgi:flagellar biosynthesis/type III secretory pathway protein FliH
MHTEPKIIKAAAPLPARRIEAAVWETDRRVREMVATAEAHARGIVAAAEAERSRVFAEAAEAGRAEGHARAATLLASAAAERERRLAGSEREIVRLAIEVARKVLGSELAVRPAAIADLAASALAAARDRREATLRVSPADAAALRSAQGRLATLVGRARFAIREDPSVERGGAIVDTEAGRLDARIDTQLAALGRALEEACE